MDGTSTCGLSGRRRPCRHRHRRRASNLCSASASSRPPFRRSYHGRGGHVMPLRCPRAEKSFASSWLRGAAHLNPAQWVGYTGTAAPFFFRVPPAPPRLTKHHRASPRQPPRGPPGRQHRQCVYRCREHRRVQSRDPERAIVRWTAPTPRASNLAKPVKGCPSLLNLLQYQARVRNDGRHALEQTTAQTQGPVAVQKLVSQRPSAATNASSLLKVMFSKRLDLSQRTLLNRERQRERQRQQRRRQQRRQRKQQYQRRQ